MAAGRIKLQMGSILAGILILLVLVTSGLWATATVRSQGDGEIRPGEKVKIDFTCLTAGGGLVASSDPKAGEGSGAPASILFRPRNTSQPLVITAGDAGSAAFGEPDRRTFEAHILAGLCKSAVGMKVGAEKAVILEADPQALMSPKEIVDLARKRNQPKTLRVSLSEFADKVGSPPVIGEKIIMHTDIPGRVVSVSATEAVVSFPADAAEKIMTDFGPASILDKGDSLELVYDARPGTLVRAGWMVGRIAASTEEMMTLDFRHPFGGETLACKVKVDRPAADAKQP
jgi:FKBP-type peptidyl-prolyl cis-trans isomerase 2